MGKPIKGLYTNDWEQHKQNANSPLRVIHLLTRLPLVDVAYRRGRGGGLQWVSMEMLLQNQDAIN